nr:glutathione reductase [Fusobacterium gastrosuis]
MENMLDVLKRFLQNPKENEEIIDADTLIWVDWREYDEDIISYFSEKMKDKIEVEFISNNQPYGDDICLKYKDKSLIIPYKEKMDRDTTIKYLNEFIKPKYEIRLWSESLGDDTLAFIVLKQNLWEELEKEFGKRILNNYFCQITLSSKMFDLQYDVVEYARLKKLNPDVSFFILVSYLEIDKKEKNLIDKKNKGEIDLKNYLQQRKEIKAQKDTFICEYNLNI